MGREQADDSRAAIELAAERLEHQIRRLKDKRLGRRRNGRSREIELHPAAEAGGEEPIEESFDEPPGPSGNGGLPTED